MKISNIIRWRGATYACLAAGVATFGGVAMSDAAQQAAAPIVCNKGPSGQRFVVGLSAPSTAEAGSTYTVRIDGVSSGTISHFGLNHLHDMTVEYVLPSDASYVEGSAQIIPGTGTANVRAGARLWYRSGVLTLNLPDKVENGTSYTPPSFQFKLKAVGAPGSSAAVAFRQFRLKANAVVVGDVAVSCEPTQKPYAIGATKITGAASAARD